MKDEHNDIVKDLMTRYLAGEASFEEEKQLLAWIAQHPDNEAEYLATKKVFELSQQHYTSKATESIDIDKEWGHFVNTIRKEKPVRKLTPETSSSSSLI